MWSIQQGSDSGPERAQRRAWARGLEVGKPVRVVHPGGDPRLHFGMQQSRMVPKRIGLFGGKPLVVFPRDAGQREQVPLEFGERLSNYRIQQAVRTHSIGGTRWRPTPRQRRRLNHKARAAAKRHYVADQRARFEAAHREASHELVAAWNEPARLGVAPPVLMENPPERPRGFTMIDRRGEHAAR